MLKRKRSVYSVLRIEAVSCVFTDSNSCSFFFVVGVVHEGEGTNPDPQLLFIAGSQCTLTHRQCIPGRTVHLQPVRPKSLTFGPLCAQIVLAASDPEIRVVSVPPSPDPLAFVPLRASSHNDAISLVLKLDPTEIRFPIRATLSYTGRVTATLGWGIFVLDDRFVLLTPYQVDSALAAISAGCVIHVHNAHPLATQTHGTVGLLACIFTSLEIVLPAAGSSSPSADLMRLPRGVIPLQQPAVLPLWLWHTRRALAAKLPEPVASSALRALMRDPLQPDPSVSRPSPPLWFAEHGSSGCAVHAAGTLPPVPTLRAAAAHAAVSAAGSGAVADAGAAYSVCAPPRV
jgi:hypothetical protein